ncbi:MAG: hypothetical protein A2928_00775 [Candidatus Taylorbacteria bacterium RIFCSPLOWO2_01_FULL_45_15b]|uniref:Uncharacterized protein n=1 Tax=Candidatus Taylorbacteria bacterium RIFCSPLOWO2_01_FULL_45_15b TaxID=1802319 RepID=A0A1G2NAC3_9BACT|nr:MAG: hypothetical protein A2928_00775 [Candidatus Taylorbacteria bacterium RIFCSPLOWO2_01_FULL_45_15b]
MPRLTWFATQAEKKLGCNPLHSASEAMQLVFTGSTLISFGIICAILADLKSITFMWLMFTLGGTCIAGTLFKRLKVRKFTRTLEFIGNTIRAVGLVPSALYDELHDDDLLIDEVFELFKKTLHRIAVQIVIWEKRDDGLAMDNARVQRELFTKFHKTAALFGINLGPYGEYYKTAVPDLKTPEANTEETTA